MNEILSSIERNGIVPVVVIENENDAESLARALMEGGLSTLEITFRTAAAPAAIAKIARAFPGMIIGAGTVFTVEQVRIAIDNGAQYIVSPGFSRTVVEYCLRNETTVLPGVLTPTEIQTGVEVGLEVFKYFPAEAAGGIKYLTAISGPFRHVKFVPTGGIDQANLLSYLRHPNVLACGGSWMVKSEYISMKRFNDITKMARQAVDLVTSIRDKS